MENKYVGPERRQYVRLEQIISVEYNFVDDDKSIRLSKKHRGVIQNVSAGGVRLQVEDLDEAFIQGLYSGIVKIGLVFKLPDVERPVKALARVVWLTKTLQETESGKINYILGLEFTDITTIHTDIIRDYIIRFYLEEKIE